MDVLLFIKDNHYQILAGVEAMRRAASISEKRDAAATLHDHLQIFFKVQQQFLYPEFFALVNADDQVERLSSEGKKILKASADLRKIIKPKTKLEASALELKELKLEALITAYLDIEDDRILPKFRERMPTQEREDLAQVMIEFRDEEIERLGRASEAARRRA